MRIDQLSVDLRARNPWEAFDLGIALARLTAADLFMAFTVPYLAFVLLVNLVAWGYPTAALLIVWWLKPVFDRIALHVIAQAVFGPTPPWRATLKSLWQIPRTGLLYSLTLGRFDLARSFHLAVLQLEGQTGKARRRRIAVLDKRARGPAVWLTVVIIHFVYVILLGFDGLLTMISPAGVHFSLHLGEYFFRGGQEPSLTSQHLFNCAFAVVECILEPLYVAAGFSLYLARRTALEGWDLEVAFKRMTARVAAAGGAMTKVVAVLLTVVALQGAAGNEAWAQDGANDPPKSGVTAPAGLPDPAAATAASLDAAAPSTEKQAIDDILKGPDFKQYEDRQVWRRKNPPDTKSNPKIGDGWLVFAQYLAEAMRIAIWVVAIGFLGWLLYYLSQRLGWFRDLIGTRRSYRPDVLFGLDLRAESLPDDIPGAARTLLAQGDMRGALSLLYRGALRVLIHERELDVRDGDTEGDCVRRVNRTVPLALAEYFRGLVEAWGLMAYARRAPEQSIAQRLVDEWAHHFAPPPESEPA